MTVLEEQTLIEEQQRTMNILKEARVVAQGDRQRHDVTSTIYVYFVALTQGVYPKEGKLFLPQPYKVLQFPMKGQTYLTSFDNITSTDAYGSNPEEDDVTDGFNLVGKPAILKDIKKNKEIRYNNSVRVVLANRAFKELGV